MVLVVVIGDFHIPYRASEIPQQFRKLLAPGKIQQIICTGNLCDRETYDFLKSVCADVKVVKGEFDDPSIDWPQTEVITHGVLKFGVINGHQIVPQGDNDALAMTARQLDVDILLMGHRHKFEAFEYEGKFYINPGSATGAFHTLYTR